MRLSGRSAGAAHKLVRAQVCPLPFPAISHASKSAKPGGGGVGASRQHPKLVRIGRRVEVSADDGRERRPRDFEDERDEVPDRALPHRAGMGRPVESHRERRQHPARSGDAAEESGPAPAVRSGSRELAVLVVLDGPPGEEPRSGSPIFGEERAAAVGSMVAKGLGEPLRLILAGTVAPYFLKGDDVGVERL